MSVSMTLYCPRIQMVCVWGGGGGVRACVVWCAYVCACVRLCVYACMCGEAGERGGGGVAYVRSGGVCAILWGCGVAGSGSAVTV